MKSLRLTLTAVLVAMSALAQDRAARAQSSLPIDKLLTFDQMRAAMETSGTSYAYGDVAELGGKDPAAFARELWPGMENEPQSLRVVVGEDGRKRVIERSCSPEAERELEAADALYFGGERERALAGYNRAARLDRACSDALRGGAECHLKLGRTDDAVRQYRAAIDVDPGDHRLRFFYGSALFAAGKPDEAVEQMIESLVLRPRFEFALSMLRARSAPLGLRIHDEDFAPKATARADERRVTIYAPVGDPSAIAWTAWATCKGFWMGEEPHRLALAGQARRGFTTVEELECLAALVATYQQERAAGRVPEDPQLSRIERIVMDGYGTELIAYEMASRVVPWATLLLDEAQKQRLRDYVRRYVVTRP